MMFYLVIMLCGGFQHVCAPVVAPGPAFESREACVAAVKENIIANKQNVLEVGDYNCFKR